MTERRTYTIPLRKGFSKKPRQVRTNRAVRDVKAFLAKHMKATDVKLGRALNESMWTRGIRRPPARVTVITEKNDEGIVYADLEGQKLPSEIAPKEPKKKEPQTVKEKIQAKVEENKAAATEKPAAKETAPKTEAKPTPKKAPAKKTPAKKAPAKKTAPKKTAEKA